MAASANASSMREPSAKEIRLVIAVSLAAFIGAAFFSSDNTTLSVLLTWAGFAIGFGFRPLGAILFGYLGDRQGRKDTFLITVTLMGIATAAVGIIPPAGTIGIAAFIIILLRVAQGSALAVALWGLPSGQPRNFSDEISG